MREKGGETMCEIAQGYNVSRQTISRRALQYPGGEPPRACGDFLLGYLVDGTNS